jgi:probable DNA repair protein
MFADLFASLQPDTLLLTANKRLASWITHAYYQLQISKNIQAWESIDTLPYTSWLQRCFQEMQTSGIGSALTLLNSQQEQFLWQKTIATQTDEIQLAVPAAATTAQQAWQLSKNWQIDYKDLQITTKSDTACFTQWTQLFLDVCTTNNWLDCASLPGLINKQLKNGALHIAKHIKLIGFIEIPPAMQMIIDTLKQRGCCVTQYHVNNDSNTKIIHQFAAPIIEDEIHYMAQWAKHIFNSEKNSLIGCIIPNINEHRSAIARIFTEVFSENLANAYNISSGEVFIDEPIIYTAIEILRFANAKISVHDCGYLLRSPYLYQTAEAYTQHAIIDVHVREYNQTNFNLKQLINIISLMKNVAENNFLHQLQQLQNIEYANYQAPSQWAHVFMALLAAIGWPGKRKLNHREHLALQRWQSLLQEFASLDLIVTSCSYAQALRSLKQLAAQVLFQPQTTEYASIQILGMLEATGLPFTHAWIMNLDDKHWPAPAKPNPFIPVALQRQYNMPHASAEREYQFSKLLTNQFIKNIPSIIFSYATINHDEKIQPSPLIKNFPKIPVNQITPYASQKPNLEKIAFTTITNDNAPSYQASEPIEKSTYVFKHQAACPFRAFAEFRLHATKLPTPEEGISATDRGKLAHKVLEIIWSQLRSQQKLIQLSDTELENIITTAIDSAMQDTFKQQLFKQEIRLLEKNRLQQLILAWLQQEKKRYPFKVVELEQKHAISFNELQFNVRVDRIDQVANDTHVLIDYKSGKVNPDSWLGNRPDEPQLPLYASKLAKKIAAIAFAQLNPTELQFKSMSVEQNYLLPNTKPSKNNQQYPAEEWQAQLSDWQQTVAALAQDFCQGKATVDPKNQLETCKYCQLHTLCRIHER